jgi:uridine kinase
MSYSKVIDYLSKTISIPIIISIDGVAGSGKTTLAQKIKNDLTTVEIIHMDDLYDGWKNPLSNELSTRIANQILIPYVEGMPVKYKKYNWLSEKFDEEVNVPPTKYLILEGVGSGQKALRHLVDLSIWIEYDPNLGLERVIKRDGEMIRNHMLNFLIVQDKHFSKEETSNFAHYTLDGAP